MESMDKLVSTNNMAIGSMNYGLKFSKCNLLLLVIIIQAILISGCTAAPPDDVLKRAARMSACFKACQKAENDRYLQDKVKEQIAMGKQAEEASKPGVYIPPAPPNDIYIRPYFSDDRVEQCTNLCDETTTIKNFKVINKYEEKIINEIFTVYEFIFDASNNTFSGTVKIIKRGSQWYYLSERLCQHVFPSECYEGSNLVSLQ